ncbi:MAG: glycosyltransferase family 39 protein, partial [Ilumatobacteraceae bacterium]
MSIATRFPPLAEPDLPPDEWPPAPSGGAITWAVVPAGLIGAATATPTLDLTRALIGGVCAAALMGLVLIWTRREHGIHLDRTRSMAAGVGAGLLVGLGAVGARAHLVDASPVAQAIVGWFVVLLLVTPDRAASSRYDRLERVTDGAQFHARLATTAATAVAVVCLVALALPSGVEFAGAFGAAVPIASIFVLAVAGTATRNVSSTAISPTAVMAGVAAGLLALIDQSGSKVELAGLLALLVVSVAAALLLRRARATELPRWLVPTGLAVALVASGAAPGVVVVAGLGAGLALEVRRRRQVWAPAAEAAEPSGQRTRTIVASLTLVAVGLRVIAPRGLWLDEATSVHQARLGFGAMIRLLYDQDNHPPLHDILLWLDIRLVGDSEFALRLPSVIIGSLLVPMLYVAAKELFGRRAGLIAAAIGTVAPVAVWYGQEARMYAQFMLLALIVVWAQVRILRTGERRYWVVFTLCCVALIYSQYFAALHVVAVYLVFAIELLRRRHAGRVSRLARQTAMSVLAGLVLVAPLIPFALHQAVHNQQAGFGFSAAGGIATGSAVVPPPGIYGLLSNVQWALWGYQPDSIATRIVALWPVGLLVLLLLLGRQRRGANRYLLLIAALPVGVVFAASFFAAKSRSLAEVRYFAGAVPVLFLLIAGALATAITSSRVRCAVVGALLVSMVLALGVQETSAQNPRLYQYREAIAEVVREARPGDQLVYSPEYLNYVLEYYNPG